jgi:putative transcriptional regulator
MLSNLPPSVGNLLISEPFLADPNFARSVVLIAEESESGVLGVVFNQRSYLLLSDLVPKLEGSSFPMFIGGPVEVDSIFYIHRCFEKIQSGFEIAKGLYWSYDFDIVHQLINENNLSADEIRFFQGYSGWAPLQLREEIDSNTWIVSDRYEADLIFHEDDKEVWAKVIKNLGPKYAHLVNFPKNPNLN